MTISRAFGAAGIPVRKEPAGLVQKDGKRPDGCTLIPWRDGRPLACDVTVCTIVGLWRRQAWGTGARAPLLFDARKILQPFLVSTYRPVTHIKALIVVTVAGCCKKTLVVFVFADLTPEMLLFSVRSKADISQL